MNRGEPVTVYLDFGYTDSKGLTHTRVTIGKRATGKVLFQAQDDPQGALPTQYQDLVLRACITEFGTLATPVALNVLLSLDSIDREALYSAYGRYARQVTTDDGEPARAEPLGNTAVKLILGYEEAGGVVYDAVEFGTRITGHDEIEADRRGLEGLKRNCFLAGRQVIRLYQSNGTATLAGPMTLDMFETLDGVDVAAIRVGAEAFRNSFRGKRKDLLPERGRADSSDVGA